MNSKRWLALFLATVVLLGAAVVAFNYWSSPTRRWNGLPTK